MIRQHGRPPFTTAVVHGGPGARGSLYYFAKELSHYTGVLEPIQSAYSVEGLQQQLLQQLQPFAQQQPLVLIGHSWGAWLALLTAVRQPAWFTQLVLIGCPPLTPDYQQQIQERRLDNLPLEDAKRYVQALKILASGPQSRQEQAFGELDELCARADNVCPEDFPPDPDGLTPDLQAFNSVWPQAQALRKNGSLLKAVQQLSLPVTLIQGLQDPHPAAGVYEPFAQCAKPLTTHLLPRCGHNPFAEKYARKDFYQILSRLLH